MQERSIYQDISARTDGNIYIGVVGPVRTGKSTFIKRFMDTVVIPNIEDHEKRRRANDELPQSASGKTIMTTEPKFIPEEAVEVCLESNASFKVRMIDCVGYIVPTALGYMEDEAPRMVKTPWSAEEMEFGEAAEIGTKKVITEHSTIGLVITTDGSISDIPREDYEESEKRVVSELKEINKPFIILLNCVDPNSANSQQLAASMSRSYQVPVLPVNCMELGDNEIKRILAQVLFEFPIREIRINLPKWVMTLEKSHWLRCSIFDSLKSHCCQIEKIREISDVTQKLCDCENISGCAVNGLDLGRGEASLDLTLDKGLFYRVLSEKTGLQISDEKDLLECFYSLSQKQKEFDKIAMAYEQVQQTGYGIVMPTMEELTLEEPQIIKQSGKYGIRLKASAPSIHMMRVQTTAEVTPIVGSEQQSEELVNYMLSEFEENPVKIWQSNIFGKSVHELVNEGLHNKLYRMPENARLKLSETLEKIINDGCNGLICIII